MQREAMLPDVREPELVGLPSRQGVLRIWFVDDSSHLMRWAVGNTALICFAPNTPGNRENSCNAARPSRLRSRSVRDRAPIRTSRAVTIWLPPDAQAEDLQEAGGVPSVPRRWHPEGKARQGANARRCHQRTSANSTRRRKWAQTRANAEAGATRTRLCVCGSASEALPQSERAVPPRRVLI